MVMVVVVVAINDGCCSYAHSCHDCCRGGGCYGCDTVLIFVVVKVIVNMVVSGNG